jgi:hypothetical protein
MLWIKEDSTWTGLDELPSEKVLTIFQDSLRGPRHDSPETDVGYDG